MNKHRSSNFELLRIISMLLIVFHHFGVHGGFDFATDIITVNRLWIQLISIGGKIGVNIFVLISGYFLIEAQKLSFKKVFKLLGQLIFYSVGIYVICCVIGIEALSITGIVKSFFPVMFQCWWFASTYFVLYLLFPFINEFLKNLTKQMYQKFLLAIFVLWCLIPTFTNKNYQCNELLWFIFLYAIAAYVKMYGIWNLSAKQYLFFGVSALLLTFFSAVVFDILGMRFEIFAKNATYFYGMQKFPAFFTSVLLFLGFRTMRIQYIPLINIVASAAFGVYLIHDHATIRSLLWSNLLANSKYSESSYLILYSLIVVMVVFIVCIGIELLRIFTLERVWLNVLDKCESKWLNFYANLKKRLNVK